MNDPSIPAPPANPGTYISPPFASGTPARFSLGTVVSTPGAMALLRKHGTNPLDLLQRHQRGDWGDLTKQDRIANDVALVSGSRLLSAYMVMGNRIWVITEAVGEDGTTRASSCILLPEEY
jgi:hypothetical protein